MNDCFLPGYISSLALFIGSVRVLETSLISDNDGLQMGLASLDFIAIYIVDNHRQCFPDCRWSSDGSGVFDLAEAEGLKVGSKIVIHLNGEAQEFAKEDHVKEIVEKYR